MKKDYFYRLSLFILVLLFSASTIYAESVTKFVLINSQNDTEIGDLKDGDEIDLADGKFLNIRAVTSPEPVGGKCFLKLSGTESKDATEGVAPYALFGDNSGNYNDWVPTKGTYKLEAWATNSAGTASEKYTVSFTVVDSNPDPDPDPDPDPNTKPVISGSGMKIGPNYIVWEAEATDSPLGKWELVTPGDPRYHDEGTVPPIGETHLEFTGNDHNAGPATSPLEYTFVCPKTGKYRLGARLYQRLEGQPEDKCNDVYIRMAGNFTSGNDVPLNELKHNQKFYGRGVNKWGALFNLDLHDPGHRAALYNLIEGETYTLTVSGRAQRTNIDYWLLYETSLPIILESKKDLAALNPEEYRPNTLDCKTIMAVDMDYKGIDGFTDAQTDNKAGMDILQIPDRLAWAAAQMVFDGIDGEAVFTINSMLETDGESTYRVLINDSLVGEVTNDRIHGTNTEDYTIQTRVVNQEPVALRDGDVIRVEFNNTTNGLVAEGNTTATARGRWVSLEICTSGRFTNYSLKLSKESLSMPPEKTLQLSTEVILPPDGDTTLVWSSSDENIVKVSQTGLIESIVKGSAKIYVSTTDGEYIDSCAVKVVIPEPYHGTAIPVPGIIEAEDFDLGGQGASYNDDTPSNEGSEYRPDEAVDIEICTEGGYNIGWTADNEWLKYTINVAESGNYYIETRVASLNEDGNFRIEIDGVDVTGTQTFKVTGGWQDYITVTAEDIDLTAGEHSLTFYFVTGKFNLNWMRMYVTGTTFNVSGITLSKTTLNLKIGNRQSLTAEILPENATDKTVNWSSLDPAIATVDQNGLVTAVGEGETTILAETEDGGYSAMCSVIVSENTSGIANNEQLVKVYPNPFNKEFVIENTGQTNIERIVVRNSLGQVIHQQNTQGKSIIRITPSTKQLKGLYLLEIVGKTETQTMKLIAE